MVPSSSSWVPTLTQRPSVEDTVINGRGEGATEMLGGGMLEQRKSKAIKMVTAKPVNLLGCAMNTGGAGRTRPAAQAHIMRTTTSGTKGEHNETGIDLCGRRAHSSR